MKFTACSFITLLSLVPLSFPLVHASPAPVDVDSPVAYIVEKREAEPHYPTQRPNVARVAEPIYSTVIPNVARVAEPQITQTQIRNVVREANPELPTT
ncbi:hypothetical protein MMC20_000003 [Loxospora ochrophaea]|nr:hypothetical protein [Loxospora ochrophaea]